MKTRFVAITVALLFICGQVFAEAFCYTTVQTSIDSWQHTVQQIPGSGAGMGPLWYSTNAGVTWQPAPSPLIINTGLGSGISMSNVRLQRRHFITGAPIGPIFTVSPC